MKKVSVIIPNYNGEKYILGCINSLKRQTFRDFDVIFVDNASEDNSLQMTRENAKPLDIQYIVNNANYGFAKAVNMGIKASKGEYVILLNNDTKVGKHFVEELVTAIESDENIFSAQALILQYNNRNRIDTAGDFYCAIGYEFSQGKDRPAGEYSEMGQIFSSCAGAAIYRKKIFERIGYFDEDFFAYLEDVDIGYRAKLYGYDNVIAPKAKVLHIGSATSGSKYNEFKVSLAARNNIFLMYKNFAPWQLALNCIPVACGIAVKAAFFAEKGLLGAYAKGIYSGITNYEKIKRVRYKNARYVSVQKDLYKYTLKRLGGK